MAKYTHKAGSNFPNEVYTVNNFQDVNTSMAGIINTIKQYQASGNYRAAAQYIQDYASIDLKKYLLDSAAINRIDEETRNLEIYSKNRQQQIFYQETDPEDMLSLGDVWIGDFETEE